MKKKIGFVLLGFLIILFLGAFIGIRLFNNFWFKEKPNYLSYSAEVKPIHFNWASDSIGDYFEPQAAMTIPVKFAELNHKCYMQFDTGSPFTFIYEKDLISLKKIGLKISEVMLNEERYVEHLEFELGGNKVSASMLKILEGYGHSFNAADTNSIIKIGTIGSDFITDKITAIDFGRQQIQTFQKRPHWMDTLHQFKPFQFQGRRIMLPAIIADKKYTLLYDSGCSAFGLITTKNRFESYTDENTELIEYGANSWGSKIPIKNKSTTLKFQIGNADLNLERVSYVNMYAETQRFITPFTQIGGWLGNRPFSESTLILDTNREEFMVISSIQFNEISNNVFP